jgi:molecular chaperone GrpE
MAEEENIEEKSPQEPQEPQEVLTPEEEILQLKAELDEQKRKYVLLLADSENQRKRIHREREELTKYAVERMIVEFLHPLDQFSNALGFADQGSDEVKNWAAGFHMILSQFKDVLVDHGVHEFKSEGETFDPHRHEALETLTTDEYPPDTIIREIVKGYIMGKRVIRPARVKVAKAPEVNTEKNEELSNEREEKE